MKEFIIKVEGMECSGCEKRIVNVLSTLPYVEKVTADYTKGTVTIMAESINEQEIEEKIDDLGFNVKK